jgi:translocation and assembly module TamB
LNTFLNFQDPNQKRRDFELVRASKTKRPIWKRITRWVGAGLLLVIAIGFCALLILPRIHFVRQYVLRFAESKVDSALGTEVQIRDFALSPFRLKLDLFGIIVKSAAPNQNSSLLTVDHVGVQAGITSLFHREWYLRKLTVDHPVARVFVAANGTNNLPSKKSASNGSSIDIFKLGVRHAVLNKGEIYYNNRESPLDADLHDLQLHSTFVPATQRYSGTIHYDNGHLQMRTFSSIPHDLSAQFNAMPSKFSLQHTVLHSGNSKLELTATLENYSDPQIHLEYSAVVDNSEFRRILERPSIPSGIVATKGAADYQSQPAASMLASLRVNGDLGSDTINVQTTSFHGKVTNLAAHYSLMNGDANVTNMHAQLLGGKLSGDIQVRDIAGSSQGKMQVLARGISLTDLQAQTKSTQLNQIRFAGILNAEANAKWDKGFSHLLAQVEASIHAQVGSRNLESSNRQSAGIVPITGNIHARYDAAREKLSLQQSEIHLPESSLNLNGSIGNNSSLQVIFRSSDLHELQQTASAIYPALQNRKPFNVYGKVLFTGNILGSTKSPQLTGQLRATNLKFQDSALQLLQTNVALGPSSAALHNGEIQISYGGHISFDLSAGLHRWSYGKTSPISLQLKASRVNIEDLTKLTGRNLPANGMISANLAFHGSESNPSAQGNVTLTKAKLFNEPVQSVNLNVQSAKGEVRTHLHLLSPAGSAQGSLAYFPNEQWYEVQVQAPNVKLEKLQTVQAKNLTVFGVLNLMAKGQGSIKNPELSATVESPQLQVHGENLDDVKLQADLANHVAKVAMNAHAFNTLINAKATVNTTGDYQTDGTIDTQTIPLQPLLAAYSSAEAGNVSGQTEFHVVLHGPLKNKSALEAHATIPVLQMSYGGKFEVGAAGPIHIDLVKNVLTLQKASLQGTGTNMQLEARLPLAKTEPMSVLALGTVDLQIAQMFDPDLTSSGQLKFNINSFGAQTSPDVQGQIHIVNANFASNATPVGLQNGNGVLTLTKSRLDVTQFTGTIGGGNVQASGGILYKPSLHFDLAVAAKNVRLLYPRGVRESLTANITLGGTMEAATLGGTVHISQLWFTPDFDLNSFMGQFAGAVAPPPTQGFTQNLQLNLSVQSTNTINLVSRELSVDGDANLNIHGTAAEPVVLGRVNINNGDLIFMGNRYLLQGGTIDFANPSETLPVLNVTASTTIQQYDIHLQFRGPADHLTTNYTSVPSLPPSDIINLLVFGKTAEASATNPMPGNLGAESLIASQISSQFTSRIEKIAGISQLSIDPVLAGNGSENPGARITIQQRVTGNLFVTFSSDTTQTQNQVIELQYNLSPRVTISGTGNQNGSFNFDTRITKSW